MTGKGLIICWFVLAWYEWTYFRYIIEESRHTARAVEYSTIMPLLCEETNTLAKHAPQSPCLCELNELTSTTSLSRFSTYLWVFGHLKQSLKDIFVANLGFWWKRLLRLYTKYTRDCALAEVHAQFSSRKKLSPWGPERDEIFSKPLPLRWLSFPTLICGDGCNIIDSLSLLFAVFQSLKFRACFVVNLWIWRILTLNSNL